MKLYLGEYTLRRGTLSNPTALAPPQADFPEGTTPAKAQLTEPEFDFCIYLGTLILGRGAFLVTE